MAIDDNQKIGIGLICLGLLFIALGVMLFFDTSLIAIGKLCLLTLASVMLYLICYSGNVLFLAGLCFSIGFQRTFNLFTR